MGAKFWSDEEKQYFVDVIVPLSQYASGTHDPNRGRTFVDLASKMQRDLDLLNQSRRQYTGDLLYEHWYQKVRPQRDTPGRHAPSPVSGSAAPPARGFTRGREHLKFSDDYNGDEEGPVRSAMPIETLLQKYGNTGPFRFSHPIGEGTFKAAKAPKIPEPDPFSVVRTPPIPI